VISLDEKRAHFREIPGDGRATRRRRDEIEARASALRRLRPVHAPYVM